MNTATVLDYWKQAIAQLGVGAIAAFNLQGDYRAATTLEQIDLADGTTLAKLLPLLDADQQRLLVLLASCRQPMLARELSLRSGLLDIDRLVLLPKAMQTTAIGLIRTHYLEGLKERTEKPLRAIA